MTRRVPISNFARRGLTFLEVILATVILVFVASVGMGSLSFILSQSERQQTRLAAMELANRLMIIFLDDEVEFGKLPRALEYEGRRYRWESSQANITVDPVISGDQANSIRSAERLRSVAIEVWLSDESGGSREPGGFAPSARLVRMVDIFNQNPDSVQHMISDEAARRAFIERATSLRGRAGSRPPGRPGATGAPGGPPSIPPPGPGGAR